MSTPRPTMGHPTLNAAIIALHEVRVPPKAIAQRLKTTSGTVYTALARYRKETGRRIEPISDRRLPDRIPSADYLWERTEAQRRREFHARAVLGARRTLMEAAGL